MTDQSHNDQIHASFFRSLGNTEVDTKREAAGLGETVLKAIG